MTGTEFLKCKQQIINDSTNELPRNDNWCAVKLKLIVCLHSKLNIKRGLLIVYVVNVMEYFK